jgi:preprotein translocase subunit SecA
VPFESVEEQWDLATLEKALRDEWSVVVVLQALLESAESLTDEDIVARVVAAANQVFDTKLQLAGEENFQSFQRMVLLQSLDTHWREHLSALDYLRQGIHLRGYAQKQPKQEYKREAFELFGQLLDSVKNEVTRVLMNVRVQSPDQLNEAAQQIESKAEHISNIVYTAPTETGEVETIVDAQTSGQRTAAPDVPRVGRNEPCPCGSGQKYKHCHGKLA